MSRCPWCNAKLRPWKLPQLRERCPGCHQGVTLEYWDFCAWCGKDLAPLRKRNGRRRTG